MRTTSLALLTGLLVVATGGAALARDDEGRHARDRTARTGDADPARGALAEVPNGTAAGEPGHGWGYFSDSAGRRAVVISPDGAYHLSRGQGLRRVAQAGAGR